jgi:copper resistance protein D
MTDSLILARAVHFAASLLVGGAGAIVPLARTGEAETPSIAVRRRRIEGVMLGALAVALVSGAAWLVILAAQIDGSSLGRAMSDGTAWTLLTGTRFGRVWRFRLIAVAILVVLIVVSLRQGRRSDPLLTWLEAAVALGFAAGLAPVGHGGAGVGPGGAVHLASDVLHLIAASIWVGGLLPLLILIAPIAHFSLTPAHRIRILYDFSELATVAVILLLATGVANACFMLQKPDDLITSSYGNLVLAKLVLFCLMLVFAACNRFLLAPHLEDYGGELVLRKLQVSIAIELALGTVVVCVVAVLGAMQPPMPPMG